MMQHQLISDFGKMFDYAMSAKDKDFDSYVAYWMGVFGKAYRETLSDNSYYLL